MNVAVGSLVLLGFILILFGIIFKYSRLNLMEPIFSIPISFFTISNTCFLVALVIDKFDTDGK